MVFFSLKYFLMTAKNEGNSDIPFLLFLEKNIELDPNISKNQILPSEFQNFKYSNFLNMLKYLKYTLLYGYINFSHSSNYLTDLVNILSGFERYHLREIHQQFFE